MTGLPSSDRINKEAIHPKSQRFLQLCDDMKNLHLQKSYDYGSKGDPLENFTQARELGIDPFQGIILRMNDKMVRVKNFIKKGNLQNESVYDALRDIAAYANLAIVQLEGDSTPTGEVAPHGPR